MANHGQGAPSHNQLASMQEQLNSMQQMFNQMAQSMASGQPGYNQNFPSNSLVMTPGINSPYNQPTNNHSRFAPPYRGQMGHRPFVNRPPAILNQPGMPGFTPQSPRQPFNMQQHRPYYNKDGPQYRSNSPNTSTTPPQSSGYHSGRKPFPNTDSESYERKYSTPDVRKDGKHNQKFKDRYSNDYNQPRHQKAQSERSRESRQHTSQGSRQTDKIERCPDPPRQYRVDHSFQSEADALSHEISSFGDERRKSENKRDRKRSRSRSINRGSSNSSSGAVVGKYDEVERKVEKIVDPDWIVSSHASVYYLRDLKTGNMVATKKLLQLEDEFEEKILKRSARAREGRPLYKYPERTARLTCCKVVGCSHDSEDDSTDDSELEEGEIKSDSDEDPNDDDQELKLTPEIQAKLNHPERLHKYMCFNDKGETNSGPLCKCSRKNRRHGIRHAVYRGENLLAKCLPDSNNLDKLFHYRIKIIESVNLKTSTPTSIIWDGRAYDFGGFSVLLHQKIDKIPAFKTIMYNNYYNIHIIEEAAPENFTVRSLDLLSDFVFYEILELLDISLVQEEFKNGCRQIHIFPRFIRKIPDNGEEVLAISEVLKYFLTNSNLLIEDSELANLVNMDKPEWDSFVQRHQFSLVTNPGQRPSTLRVDNLDRQQKLDDVISYPLLLHYVMRSETICFNKDKRYYLLKKRHKKLKKFISSKIAQPSAQDLKNLQELELELEEITRNSENRMRREVLVELSSQGFLCTGLRTDVTQYGLIMPKILDYIRFIKSLSTLQNEIGYSFQNLEYLMLSLCHPSYMSGFSLNQDHMRNTLTNCGLRRPEFGDFPIAKELWFKKRGLKTLLEIMSENYRRYTGPLYNNERLEFLGDAILEFITSVHLFFMFPKLEEGGLSTYRTALVKNEHLTVLAKSINLHHYLLFSHGPDLCYSTQLDQALANAFEAILGAIHLDGGIDEADRFLTNVLARKFNFDEFYSVWADLPLHPIQERFDEGDRHLIDASPALQKCVEFEESTGIKFDHICLLARAFTHISMEYTDFSLGTNQTLEFLGDAVLQLVVSDFLYRRYPNHREGHLTLLRSSLVSNTTQAQIFDDIGIAKYIINLSKHVCSSGKEKADYVEALLGALYVDQGLPACTAFCDALFFSRLKEVIENQHWNDAKSLLQQCCLELREQGSGKDPDLPIYKVIGMSGPTHRRVFKVAAYFKDKRIGDGEGPSIQKAEFEAAQNALEENKNMFPMLDKSSRRLSRLGPPMSKKAKEKDYETSSASLAAYWM